MSRLIKIRPLRSSDLNTCASLFRETVHAVNANDYSQAQLDAWAPATIDVNAARWMTLLDNIAIVAELNGIIVGFADMTCNGYLDRLFVHKDHQHLGVGSALVKHLEAQAIKHGIREITTEASITAKPFFESQGYYLFAKQEVKINNISFINYKMKKQFLLFQEDHLGFRPIATNDIDYLLQLDADPDVMRFFPDGAQSPAFIKEKIQRYINDYNANGYGCFIVFDLVTNEFIGRAGFSDIESGETEVGYLVLKKYWGKGYATRILKALLHWASNNLHKDKIVAFTPVDHLASARVMQKAGMTYSRKGVMKSVDCVIYEYSLLRKSV